MRATEVAADRVGLKLFAVHEAAHVGHQIEEVSRGLAADGVGLDVLVQLKWTPFSRPLGSLRFEAAPV